MSPLKIRSKAGLKKIIDKWWTEEDYYIPDFDDDPDCDGINTPDIEHMINEILPIDMESSENDGYYASISFQIKIGTIERPVYIHSNIDSIKGWNQGSYDEMVDMVWDWIQKAQAHYVAIRKCIKPNCLRE